MFGRENEIVWLIIIAFSLWASFCIQLIWIPYIFPLFKSEEKIEVVKQSSEPVKHQRVATEIIFDTAILNTLQRHLIEGAGIQIQLVPAKDVELPIIYYRVYTKEIE